MSKHWKRFAAVVVSLTMAFQFCVNDFYAYAETTTPEQETVEQTPPEQQTQPEPEVTTEPVETPAQTEPIQEPAPEVETETTTPPEQEQPQQPAQEQTPAQPEREVAGTLKLEFKDEEGNTLKTVDPIALTNKYVGDTIRLTDLGVDTNVADYTLVDIKDKNDGTKDYNPNSVDFTLTKNITELQLVYRANPKEPETTPTENDTNTTEDSQQGEGEEDSEADPDEADQPKKASRASARSITSDGNVTTISVGQTITLSDDEGSSFGISDSWSASPNDRVSISGEGRTATVTGLKAGKVTITHSWGIMGLGDSNTFTLEVVASVDVESVGIQKDGQSIDTLALSTGDEVTLSASVEPDNASNTEVTRKSNDSEVVSVEPDGTVTALKEGSAEITVTSLDDSEISDTITVTVKDVAPTSMNVTAEGSTGNTATITKSGKVKLAVHFEPENTTNQKVEWASQNEEVATVDEDGLVTGVSNGEATITATSLEDENVTAEFTVKVDEIMMTDFQVVTDDSDNTVTVGETLNVRAIIKPDDYPNKEVKWKSSDPEVATVDDNGLVTTLKTGTVVITGTSVADSTATASVTILVEAKKVTDVKITGYDREYLITGQNVQLSAEVTPEDAADKHITWTSLDEDVLTVDQNGKVTATGQGTAIIRAENLATGVYDEIEITVYNSQPRTQEVQIWVTNSYQNQNVTINVPVDGTSVNVADAIPSFFSTSEKSYSFTGMVKTRIRNNQDSWAQIQNAPTVALLRVKNGKIQYSTTEAGSDWQNLNYKITAHYDLVYSGEDDSSDIEVVVGDWPYDKNHDATNKIIQIQIKDSETGETVYDSGNMWYDNGSNGDYGKIRFNCDESRYEVTNIRVLKYDSQNDRNPEVIDEDAEEPYSVDFSSRKGYEKYLVIATVSPKEFRVSYNANGGEGDVPASYTLTATNGNQVTVASTPTPTKDRYIFGGWEYDGKTYYGGESFEMPPENVTFVAKWIEASQVISYESNNTEWGTVNRSYDRVNEFTEIQGSLAAAKEGYRFVKWIDKETNQEVSKERFYLPTKDNAGKTFVAVFEQNTYTITTKVSNGTISPTKTVNYNGSYTVNYRPNEGYTLKSVIVDGVDVTTTNPESYTFNNVKEAHEITVVYERDTSDFSAEGFNVEYDGENHNIDTKGTLIAGEKWQYSYDENMWYDNPSAVNYINVSDSKNTVYLRVVQNDDVIYNTTVSAIITQAPVTVTVVGNHDSVEYDGIEHSVEGYTISDDSDLYNEETNVEFTGTAKATRTDEGTTKMKLTEAQFKNTDNNFNVTFSITDGYITITSKSIAPDPEDPENTMSVEGPSDVVYNGQEQKEEPVVKDGEKVLEKGVDYKLEYTENGDYTNVGEKTVKVIGINNYGGDFEVTYEITQAPVTVTVVGNHDSVEYDGIEHSVEGYTISDDSDLYNEETNVEFTGTAKATRTDEGTTKMKLTEAQFKNTDNNFNVTFSITDGYITITSKSIAPDPEDPENTMSVEGPSDVVYNGQEQKEEPVVKDGEKVLEKGVDYKLEYTENGDYTNVGEKTVKVIGINNYGGDFEVTYEITQAPVTVTVVGNHDSVEYDGIEHSVEGYTISDDSDLYNEETNVEFTGTAKATRTDEGTTKMKLTEAQFKNTDNNFNVTFSITDGYITITSKSIAPDPEDPENTMSVEGPSDVVYNGQEQKEEPVVKDGEKVLEKGVDYKLEYTENGDYTNVGEKTVKVIGINNYGGDFEVTYEITQAPVTVTVVGNHDSVEYDGIEHSVEGYTISDDSDLYNEETNVEFTGTAKATRTDEGTTKMKLTEAQFKNTDNNFNVTFSITDGYITITSKSIAPDPEDPENTMSVEGPSDVVYNGQEQKEEPVVKDGEKVLEKGVDYKLEYTENGDYTNVGEKTVKVIGINNYGGDFEVTYEITQAPVTVTVVGNHDSVEYDGIEHSVEGYTISDDSDLYNEETNVEFTGTAKATRTDEGTTKMKLTEAQFKNTDNNFNVTFSITDGYITITSKSIAPDPEDPENTMSVEGPSDVVYNGQEQKEEPVVKDGEKVLEKGVDYKLEYTENGDYTNVGEKTVKVIGINNYGGDFEVTYEITQAPVTVTTESATQVYDGTALTAPGSIEGLVNNETATLNVTGSQTNVGSSKNTASIVWDGTADKNNYEVTNDFGTLTVTKQSINPEDPDDPSSYKNVTVNNPSDVTYDGNSHQWKPTVTSGNTTLTEGTDYTVSYSTTDFTNVTDIITVTIEGTGNYRGTVTRTYQINPRAITLTSAGGTKTYDGTALTNGTVTLTGELVDPSDITYRATGTQTEVGSSLNTIEVNYASDQMRNNYEVTLVTGTLTVNAAPVTPTTPTTPGGGEGTGTTPATGGPVAAADDDADAEDEPEEEEVEDEETPLSDGEEEVDEGKTPLAKIDVWALINLIAAIITVLFGLILLLSKRHKNDDEEDEEERQARIERGEEKEQEQKRGWICKVLGVLVAIGSVVLFILTEDMSLPMAMTDEWTIWMIIIAVVELVLLLVGRHWKDVDDDEEEQAQA